MNLELNDKLATLRQIVGGCGSALGAYSGGVDSALVVVVAHQEVGHRGLACCRVSGHSALRAMRGHAEVHSLQVFSWNASTIGRG